MIYIDTLPIPECHVGYGNLGPAIAATVLRTYRAGGRGADIAGGLGTTDRSNLMQANQRATAIVAALRGAA